MATREVRMSKIREVLRYSQYESSERGIESLSGVSRSAVHRILARFKDSGVPAQDALALNDQELKKLIYPDNSKTPDLRRIVFDQKLPAIIKAMGKKHETLEHQWIIYRSDEPGGYGYSQFCYLVKQALKCRVDRILS